MFIISHCACCSERRKPPEERNQCRYCEHVKEQIPFPIQIREKAVITMPKLEFGLNFA